MQPQMAIPRGDRSNTYLYGRGPAWFAYSMTVGLMIFDYIDRQIIASMFPFLKSDWLLTDAQLGALVSVVSVTVAVFGIPVAWIADRFSRVKSITVMAMTWSMATIACMFSQGYAHLLIARAFVGLGEAGYGSVGAAMVATHFPQRMRGGILGGFFASASVGSVLGVVLGGVIASRFGWHAGFGLVGVPGLVLSLLYLFVRDYRTVEAADSRTAGPVANASRGEMIGSILRSRTVRWVCVGGAAQLISLSALWAWLPSYLNRTQQLPPDKAGIEAALVVLAGAIGSVVLGAVADRAGLRRSAGKFIAVASLCALTAVVLVLAFGGKRWGLELSRGSQFSLIVLGGFVATCTVGPAAAIVIGVIHPGVRATGASVLSLFQNLFGLAAGPFIAGALSDAVGLETALTLTPLGCVIAALSFLAARRTYASEYEAQAEIPVVSAAAPRPA
jgi:MFS transporter, Spinster family, sphingosine-1-phosphate transporter